MTQEPLNREQRRHPAKIDPAEEASYREKQNEVFAGNRPQDVSDPRTKSSQHKKVTAEHWNQ